MRINARLDTNRCQKMEFLSRVTNLGTSEILKQAIDLYYEYVRKEQPNAAQILDTTNFVGCGEGPSDLSVKYKEELEKMVAAKHDHR